MSDDLSLISFAGGERKSLCMSGWGNDEASIGTEHWTLTESV